jgi:hypothetical protein
MCVEWILKKVEFVYDLVMVCDLSAGLAELEVPFHFESRTEGRESFVHKMGE